jgi:hypothetical protein
VTYVDNHDGDDSQRRQQKQVLEVGKLVVKKVGQWLAELNTSSSSEQSSKWRSRTISEATELMDFHNPIRIRGEFGSSSNSAAAGSSGGEWILPNKVLNDGSLEVRVVRSPHEEEGEGSSTSDIGEVRTLVSEYLY